MGGAEEAESEGVEGGNGSINKNNALKSRKASG